MKKEKREIRWSEQLGPTARTWYSAAQSIGRPLVGEYLGRFGTDQRARYDIRLAEPFVGFRRRTEITLEAGEVISLGCKSGLSVLDGLSVDTLVRIVALERTELVDGRSYWAFDVRAAID